MENQLSNFWLRRMSETKLVKIVEWAQRKQKNVEDLTDDDVRVALKEKESGEDI